LELEILESKNEIVEGVLTCKICSTRYPIILSIPFLLKDLSSYFSIRPKLGGYLMLKAKTKSVKSIIKKSLKEIKKVHEDTTELEERWVKTYQNSDKTVLERKIKKIIQNLPRCNLVLEHGCSIGKVAEMLSEKNRRVFGIDKSFYALVEAKKRNIKNCDFILADSLSSPFENEFDMVVALNVLELIEPIELLKVISKQTSKFVLLSDPYDYERGTKSVKVRLDEKSLRKNLTRMGFKMIHGTEKPSFIPWKLNVNPRLELNYSVDLILAAKLKDSS
jgi:hypothetical protein